MAPFRPPLQQSGKKKAAQMHDEEGDATAYGPRTLQMLAGVTLPLDSVRNTSTHQQGLASIIAYARWMLQ